MSTWAIIPVKSFKKSKSRLAGILDPLEREELTRRLLLRTIEVVGKSDLVDETLVVSPDREVLDLARSHDALVCLENDNQGLNVALCQAAQAASEGSATAILVIPSDLPLLKEGDIHQFLSAAAEIYTCDSPAEAQQETRFMVICPDRNSEGTNALFIKPLLSFCFQFGAGSYLHHLEEASRLEMTLLVVSSPGLAFDLDCEQDWMTYQTMLQANTS